MKGEHLKMHVALNCMACGKEFIGEEPKMCCDGRECGCMGQPVEPVVCSKECYDAVLSGKAFRSKEYPFSGQTPNALGESEFESKKPKYRKYHIPHEEGTWSFERENPDKNQISVRVYKQGFAALIKTYVVSEEEPKYYLVDGLPCTEEEFFIAYNEAQSIIQKSVMP